MKKFYLFIFVALIGAVSCVKECVQTNISNGSLDDLGYISTVRSLSDALTDLDQTLDLIYSGTRSNERKRYSINNVHTFIASQSTRSNSVVDIPDTLVYIVNFDDDGYAILGAQSDVSPIYSITESGVFDVEKFENAINYEVANNIITNEEYEKRLAEELAHMDEEEFYSTDEDFAYSLTASSLVADIVSSPVIIDPTPVTPPAPEPDYPRVIDTDTIRYVEFLDYYPQMMTTKWHQDSPFNNKCKDDDGEICPAGCVVIALAQIMAYHEYPKNTKFNGIVVDWDVVKMYNNQYTYLNESPIAKQLSNLCYGLGSPDNCDVNYTPSGSSAKTRRAKLTLKNYGYKDVDRRYGFNDKNQQKAIEMISQNKPLYIDGSRTGGAHAWVLDGYLKRRVVTEVIIHYSNRPTEVEVYYGSTQQLVHCNFGWGGTHDGYYVLRNSFNTEERYIDIDDINIEYNIEDPNITKHRHYQRNFDIITYNL